MLGKLISYEMKAFGRIMLPLYGALLVLSVILGIGFQTFPQTVLSGRGFAGFGFLTLVFLFVSVCIAIFVMTATLAVTRFWKNLMGHEGYLMFSLPAGIGTIISAKTISVLIWSALSAISGVLSMMIFAMFFIREIPSNDELMRMIRIIMDRLGTYLPDLTMFLILIAVALAFFIMRIYASIAIGCQWTSHRLIGSVLAFIGLQILENGIGSILLESGYLVTELSELFWNLAHNCSSVGLQAIFIVSLLIGTLIYGAVTYYFIDRRLNLE
ncbi:MAG: hypothetical protein K5760_08420 [Clostridium sp.]|nr:hypothetical protein [Clostridium sp.]